MAEGAWADALFDADDFSAVQTVGRGGEEGVAGGVAVASAFGVVFLRG